MPLTLATRTIGDVIIIRCQGRIVAGETECLRDRVIRALQDRREIILQLGEVAFIDSSGLGMLVRLLTHVRRAGGDLRLCQVNEPILKILKITNLSQLFNVYESEEAAVTSVYRIHHSAAQVSHNAPTALCVDPSNDVLACVRQILQSAGYNVLTNSNLHDSLILIRAARPGLLVLGPTLGGSARTQRAFQDACLSLPVVELGDQFSTQDAGQAATDLLSKIDSCRQMRGSAASE